MKSFLIHNFFDLSLIIISLKEIFKNRTYIGFIIKRILINKNIGGDLQYHTQIKFIKRQNG